MADIAALTADEDGTTAASMAGTATGGDAVPVLQDGNKKLFIFRNDHTAAIDVVLKSQLTNKVIQGFGKLSKADRTKTVPANGGICIFELGAELGAYVDGAGKVQFTYTNWNAALKLLAINVN